MMAAVKKMRQTNAHWITGWEGLAVQIKAAATENKVIVPNDKGARRSRIIPAISNGNQL
jgi:hypothetical protein